MKNSMEIKFKAIPENEAFARNVVASFILPLNPSINELEDIKTAVSEAITNSIVHGYNDKKGKVTIIVGLKNKLVDITIIDSGVGINDIERARQPFFTTRAKDERSGMGFTLMESFMDSLSVKNVEGGGLAVNMKKEID